MSNLSEILISTPLTGIEERGRKKKERMMKIAMKNSKEKLVVTIDLKRK